MAENRRPCASCGAPNEEDARFCEGCGTSLARICATCGVEASATARFCRGCGAPLDAKSTSDTPDAGPVRKTVTVMFADLAGSTSFEERVDAETAREVVGRYHDLLRTTSERHRAGVTKYIGDGFMAVWGVPEIGAEDAARAVDAAVELQERFVDLAARVAETHGVELALRVAVNTGEVVVGAGDADLVGDALNVGARLEAECPRGHVVVGEETWRATRGVYSYESLGQVQVKGRTAPVAVYRWLARQSGPNDAAPFVGRGDEVRRLQAAMDDAVSERTARLVTVIGDPGVGKSRLAAEFTRAQPAARVVEARCVLEGTVALGPLVEVLRAIDLETDIPASVPERDRLLRDLNGLASGVPGSVEESFWALRRFVEVLAMSGPVVLVLDDIQWADTLLLDFIEHLVEWVKDVPVLLLALARPEIRDIRPELVTASRWASEAVHLGGLDAGATAELAAKVLGATRLPDELLTRLPSSTGGNPLFVRELIGMLAHDGVLVEEAHGWRLTIDVDAITIPPTIHALLASRLERLDAADRRVLEIASVVGSDFSLGTVRALADKGAEGIKLSLKRLRRLELAQPSGAYVGDEPVWRFHHVLIRDVAYRRLLKSDRANLHERLADWVESGGQSVAFDADEMIARHLEAAHTYRIELGTVDEHTSDLALRSARHYATSARRALDRDELVSAGTQAARGAAVAAADEALHAELLLIGCEAYLSAGDVAAGAPLVDDLERIADDSLAPWATCYRCQYVVYTDPERLLEVEARLHEAIDEFGRRADPAGLAKAHRVRAGARGRLGRIGDSEIDLFEALIAARQSGDHRQITAALGAAPGAALWGPSPVPKAGGRCLDVVRMQRMTTAAPSLEATSLRHLAVLELLRGRPDKARTMLADARQVVADLGLRHGLMETELFAGIIESMEGNPVAAEPHFRTALEGLDALGVGADAGQAAALLARSVLAQGRLDEADRHATESERLAGRNLKTAIAWRAVRAEILSASGRHDEAVAMARESVAVAAATDLVLDHAEACLALRRVLDAAGDTHGAIDARSNAEALYTAKEVSARIGQVAAPGTPVVARPAPAAGPTATRLAITNRASETSAALAMASNASDVDAAVACYADAFTFDDRRRLSGDPICGTVELRVATERLFLHYKHFEWRTLAVRGERLDLSWSECSDDDGNASAYLHVREVGDDGRFIYDGRFDEEDFEGAYHELERRYYAGEGAAFLEGAFTSTEAIVALNNRDYDRLLGELSAADLRVENRTRSAFPDRSAQDLRASFGELNTMIAISRSWLSVVHWLSPRWSISRLDRDAVGEDGEQYTWTRLLVIDIRDRRLASICQFEPDDEAAAFAYAEERARATTSRLAIANRASATSDALGRALNAADVNGAMSVFSEGLEYDDRRRLSGNAVADISVYRAAVLVLVKQYDRLEWRVLAVRGDRLTLMSTRLFSDAGFEAAYLHLFEVNDDGLIEYEGRFDEDDFDGAYRELERRYYAGEGREFAEPGATSINWTLALNRSDFDVLFNELTALDMRVENRSRSAFPDRSALEYRTTLEELDAMVVSARGWVSVICWLSRNWSVARCEREAVGEHGEHYTWYYLIAFELRDGRVASMCEFELDDEAAAFAYAEDQVRRSTSRLRVGNRASELAETAAEALQAHDVDALRVDPSDHFVYDDRRRIRGDPIEGAAELHAATERILQSYPHTEWRTMAVRGERLEMHSSRLWDADGNEATTLNVMEFDDVGRLEYFGRFEEDDFEGAYRELDRRYYAAEGAAFAEAGALATEWIVALNQGDYAKAFGELVDPAAGYENRSRSAFPDPSVSDPASYEDLNALVGSTRTWPSAFRWLSPTLVVSRLDREAIGREGEQYSWTWILVSELRDGRFGSSCLFAPEDEDAAFAYAEERMLQGRPRLGVTNRASRTMDAGYRGLNAHDVDIAVAVYADRFVFEDRRQLSGNPIDDVADLRATLALMVEQFDNFEWRTLAVRGERLALVSSRWFNDAGFQSPHLHVCEIDDDGRIIYHGNFDEEDFDGACRELDRRYYADEGAAFAENGLPASEAMVAMDQNDFDRLFGDLSSPTLRIETRSRRAFPDRSADELRAGFEELNTLVASKRTWNSAVAWLSPNCSVIRLEREAIGRDGEMYQWTMLLASEHRDGRVTSLCEFDPDDEEGAFAYAEELARATSSRLPLTNRARETADAILDAARAKDVDTMSAAYTDGFICDDRRRLSGDPVRDRETLRVIQRRIVEQYSHFEGRTLAVRGERLHLGWGRWSNKSGFETTHLYVHEVGEDGRITYEGRFDEDDFDTAYRELDRRYYAGEGAAFADAGNMTTEYAISANQGNLDRVFGELSSPDLRLENRSRSGFPDRSISEFRASMDELNDMVTSVRTWNSAICWLSPTWSIARLEREAIGVDGEHYSWTRLVASEITDGRVVTLCAFELEDEDAAFALAEERMRAVSSRISVTNPSVQSADRLGAAMNAHDIDAIMNCFSDDLVYDDRRRLTGDPISGRAEFRAAFERILAQYSHFERRVLAVRGDRLNLHWGRWSDDSGNETAYLHVYEMDDNGLQIYEGRFDEHDFEDAYRELENRYSAGEGAASAESVAISADWVTALNRGDFDRMLSELSSPEMRFESRSRSAFPERSAADLRESLQELDSMVASVRTWNSAVCWVSPGWVVARMERDAVGPDGEQYEWTRIYVGEYRRGRLTSLCEFEVDDEAAAFTYAEEQLRATSSRLAVTNRSCASVEKLARAMHAHNIDDVSRFVSDDYVYVDKRRLSGDPLRSRADLEAAIERIFQQYNHFEYRPLAVRGERMSLHQSRWSDDEGNVTAYLHVFEVGDDGRAVYEARFDAADFEGAYRDLDRRYYSGEGEVFAEAGATATEYIVTYNQGDLDRLFNVLTAPGMRFENRSRSIFLDRSIAEFRASVEELTAMVSSARAWYSAMYWPSPTVFVARFEREAVGQDDEQYAWARVYVCEVRDGRLTLSCEFDLDDEDEAFASAEERVREAQQR